MHKNDLINQVVDSLGSTKKLTKTDVGRVIDATFETIQKVLSSDDSVTLVGFGTFSVRQRAARMGRNPRTGEEIKIAASKVPVFKAGSKLKDAVAK